MGFLIKKKKSFSLHVNLCCLWFLFACEPVLSVVVTLNTVSVQESRVKNQDFIVHFARRKCAYTHPHTLYI